MNGVFDSFQKPRRGESRDGGISPLDLAELPPLLRKIIRYILREHEAGYPAICQWAAELPEGERPSPLDLDQALENLSQQSWLTRIGEGEQASYQANLRRKAGSQKMSQSVWDVLDAKDSDSFEKKDLP